MKIKLNEEYEIRGDTGKSVALIKYIIATAKKDGKTKDGVEFKKGEEYPSEKVLGYYPTVDKALRDLIRWEMAADRDYSSFAEYLAEVKSLQKTLDDIITGLNI